MARRQSGRTVLPLSFAVDSLCFAELDLPARRPPVTRCANSGRTAVNKRIQGTVTALAALALTSAAPASAPGEIAGVSIPRTPLALKAEAFVKAAEPDFLFNHSVRTFVWGALRLRARGIAFDAETAYVAALFHDAGL